MGAAKACRRPSSPRPRGRGIGSSESPGADLPTEPPPPASSGHGKAHLLRDLHPLRGHLRPRGRDRRAHDRAPQGRHRRLVLAGPRLPEVDRHARPAERSRPPAPPAPAHRERLRGDRLGGGVRARGRRNREGARGRRAERRRVLPRQPDDPRLRDAALHERARPRARHEEPLLRRRARHVAALRPGREHVRRPAPRAGARRRPHRLLPRRRREPDGVEREPHDGAGHARAARGAPRARRASSS